MSTPAATCTSDVKSVGFPRKGDIPMKVKRVCLAALVMLPMVAGAEAQETYDLAKRPSFTVGDRVVAEEKSRMTGKKVGPGDKLLSNLSRTDRSAATVWGLPSWSPRLADSSPHAFRGRCTWWGSKPKCSIASVPP